MNLPSAMSTTDTKKDTGYFDSNALANAEAMLYQNENVTTKHAGMEPLVNIDDFHVQQKVDFIEAFTNTAASCSCCEQPNTYIIFDGAAPASHRIVNGQAHLFTIKEDIGKTVWDLACRAVCNPYHKMTLRVYSKKTGMPVFKIERPFRGCGLACFPCHCCLQEWVVKTEDDVTLGHMTQPWCGGCCWPKFNLDVGKEPRQNMFWYLHGPHCIGELCCTNVFSLKAKEGGERVGQIKKLGNDMEELGAALRELVSDADYYAFTVPRKATVEQKAVSMAAMMLVDYYFFEDGGACSCNPFANPGEKCCVLNCCTQYCCGCKYTHGISCTAADDQRKQRSRSNNYNSKYQNYSSSPVRMAQNPVGSMLGLAGNLAGGMNAF